MNYYKARSQDELPKLLFDLVASSAEELETLGLTDDPLVVTEDQLINPEDPGYISYEYGICHLRIENNALVARLASDITEAQTKLTAALSVQKTRDIEKQLEYENFTYDDHQFPTTPGAVLVYQAIFESEPANHVIAAADGNYNLNSESILAFKSAFYSRLIAINSAKISPRA